MEIQDKPDRSARKARGRPRDWADTQDQNVIKSLDRAMVVLEYVSQAQGKNLSSIADDLGQSPATIYRVLVSLQGRGLVEFDQAEQRWYVGPQAYVIGARYLRRTSLVERARPIMRKLMEETGETANLGIERDGFVLFVSQVETNASIRAFFPPGTLSPMHASGIGKALLAHMGPDRLARYLATAGLDRFTEHTIVDPAALAEDLRLTRERGVSLDDEERTLGMRCIAAPVFDINREAIAGISISGPTARLGADAVQSLSGPVIEAARQLTQAIGGPVAQP